MNKNSKKPQASCGFGTFFHNLLARFRASLRHSKEMDTTEISMVSILQQNAGVYSGLYIPMIRASQGMVNNPGKVLREWAIRSMHRFGDGEFGADMNHLFNLFCSEQRPGPEICRQTAVFLCSCMEQAEIYRPHNGTLRLDESTVLDYLEKNGTMLEPDIEVTVLESAIYQDGRCLEKGFCVI